MTEVVYVCAPTMWQEYLAGIVLACGFFTVVGAVGFWFKYRA